jgi:hypothetical protein
MYERFGRRPGRIVLKDSRQEEGAAERRQKGNNKVKPKG